MIEWLEANGKGCDKAVSYTHLFHAEIDHKKPKFYALVEFPYPSGAGLHVGCLLYTSVQSG